MHLIIDGYGGDGAILGDQDVVYRFLDEYPDAIGMTKITPPHVFAYAGQIPDDAGISGFVLIAESHISIHTFPQRRYVNIDVFSCKDFDAQKALDELQAMFSLEKVRSWILERGLEYSDPEVAFRATHAERAHLLNPASGRADGRVPTAQQSNYARVGRKSDL